MEQPSPRVPSPFRFALLLLLPLLLFTVPGVAADWSVRTNACYVIIYVNGNLTIRVDEKSPPVTVFHVQGNLVQQQDGSLAVRAILKKIATLKLDMNRLRDVLETTLSNAEALERRLQVATSGDTNAKEALALFNLGLVDEAAAKLDAVLLDDEAKLAERLRTRAEMYVVQFDLTRARQTSAKLFALTDAKSDAIFHIRMMAYAFPEETASDQALKFTEQLGSAWRAVEGPTGLDRRYDFLDVADFLGSELNRRGDPISAAIAFGQESSNASAFADDLPEPYEVKVIAATSSMRAFYAIHDLDTPSPEVKFLARANGVLGMWQMMGVMLVPWPHPHLRERFMPHF